MSLQNCKVTRARANYGGTVAVIDKLPKKLYCQDKPCKPYALIGFPAEGCENCNKTF